MNGKLSPGVLFGLLFLGGLAFACVYAILANAERLTDRAFSLLIGAAVIILALLYVLAASVNG